ncbi:acyltransferase family protein [Promicromonospora sukumoe]|uniref:acyltransferase family protein n=1 Tax=Promicromonospora sukumoe TaxID=88382 RepID=UPI00365E7778
MTDERRTAPRADIQALRAVAVLAVVLYHLWPHRLTGGYVGVDVFFVISGFLITSHIARDVDAGRFSVTRFWSRRILRLLPASLLVLGVTALGVWALAPVQHWEQWFREIAASALYAQNWVLAADAVDYLAAGDVPSPVRHYWSLAVEEQLYLLWPLLIVAALALGRRLRGSRHTARWRATAVGVLVLFVAASLVASVVWTEVDPAYAYFITPTRAWEFGAGALLALALAPSVTPSLTPSLTPPTASPAAPPSARSVAVSGVNSRGVTAWAGLAMIVFSTVLFTETTPFPGAWAAMPVLGTVLVLGARASDRFTGGLAGLPPVRFLGDVSYAVYLWHWPLIVLVPYVTGHDLRTGDKVAVLAATLVLAWATRRWVEEPVRRRRSRLRPWPAIISAGLVGAVVAGISLTATYTAREHVRNELYAATAAAASGVACFGAAARPPQGEPCANPDLAGTAVPAPEAVAADLPAPFAESATDRCASTGRETTEPVVCERGDRTGGVRVALVGDSHAAHYASALVGAAEAEGWALDIYVKAGCPFSDAVRVQDDVLTAACVEWVDRTEHVLLDGDYDLVVTSQMSGVGWENPWSAASAGTTATTEASTPSTAGTTQAGTAQHGTPQAETAEATTPQAWAKDGLAALWQRLAAEKLPVAAIADVPRPRPDLVECLTAPDVDLTTGCRTPRGDATRAFDPQRGAVDRLDRPDVVLVDLTDVYCDARECLPVIGGVTVYRDADHLSDTFAGTLAPYLANALAPLLRAGS